MPKLCFAIVVGLMVCTAQATADTIKLKNGDRLTGAIVKSDEKTLVLRTDYAGEITVNWAAIQEIESKQPLHVVARNGQKHVGTLAAADNKIAVNTKDGNKVELEKSEITILRNAKEQAAEDRYLNPGWLDLWAGSADFGMALSRGNTAITTITAGADLARDTRKDLTALSYQQLSVTDRSVSPGQKLANAKRGSADYVYRLTPRVALLGISNFEFDEQQRLDLRAVAGGGMGFRLIKSERATFRVYSGVAYTKEIFDVTPQPTTAVPQPTYTTLTRNFVGGLVGEEFRYRMSPRINLFEKVEWYPNITIAGFRLNTDSGITTALNKYLSLNVALSIRYLSDPPLPGIKKRDTLLTTGVRFTFGR